jgi:EAL domain-containing protein (putative c-di-GMP-specific phosphodiesterase class I)
MGHSSLLYIKHFPVDTIKIDQSLSRDVIVDRNCQEIISTIMNLCSSLSMEAIVEYVETADQREKLSELGCRQYQGYLYSTALPAAEAAVYIRKRNRPSDDEHEWGELA